MNDLPEQQRLKKPSHCPCQHLADDTDAPIHATGIQPATK